MSRKNAKLNSISKNLSLAILGILALGLVATIILSVLPKEVAAQEGFIYVDGYGAGGDWDTEIERDNPTPVVNSIDPREVNYASGGKTITITGNGFTESSVARWNGENRPTTFIDRAHLLIHLNSGDIRSSGKYITVYNPAPGGGNSNAVFLTIKGAPVSTSAAVSSGASSRNSNSYAPSGSVQGASIEEEGMDASALVSNAIYGSEDVGFLPSGLIAWVMLAILILLVIIVIRKLYFEHKYHGTPLKHA